MRANRATSSSQLWVQLHPIVEQFRLKPVEFTEPIELFKFVEFELTVSYYLQYSALTEAGAMANIPLGGNRSLLHSVLQSLENRLRSIRDKLQQTCTAGTSPGADPPAELKTAIERTRRELQQLEQSIRGRILGGPQGKGGPAQNTGMSTGPATHQVMIRMHVTVTDCLRN
jgi:hypothetical protein